MMIDDKMDQNRFKFKGTFSNRSTSKSKHFEIEAAEIVQKYHRKQFALRSTGNFLELEMA
jgi:hypothetical protein